MGSSSTKPNEGRSCDRDGTALAPWLADAEDYAARGWYLVILHNPTGDPALPCSCRNPGCHSSGKHPRTANGQYDATSDLSILRGWAREFPFSNLGIVLAPSGLVDLAPDCLQWAAEFEQRGVPRTARFKSGGGDGHEHWLLLRPDGCPVHRICRSGEYDILSNGLVVAPPSIHVSGRAYEWIEPPNLFTDLPEAPGWVVEELLTATQADASRERQRAERQATQPNWLRCGANRADYSGLDYCSGRRSKVKPDGQIDRSRTLNAIAWELAGIGASEAEIERELAERDELLDLHKFSGRQDAGAREYARMAEKAIRGVTPRAVPYRAAEHARGTEGTTAGNEGRRMRPKGVSLPPPVRSKGVPLPPLTRPVGVPLYGTEGHR